MEDALTGLENAIAALRSAWSGGTMDSSGPAGPAAELSPAALVPVVEAIGAVGRRFDAVRAEVAAALDRASRPELGADSLAKQHGYRNAGALLAAVTGIGAGDAGRLVSVGKAIEPRMALTGEPLPPTHPHVAEAMSTGDLGAVAAGIIIGMLQKLAVRTTVQDREAAERTLVAAAPGLALDQLRKLVTQAEAYLDQDGVAPSEDERRGERYARMWERDGFLFLDAKLDVASGGAALKTALEALVTAGFREAKDDVITGDDDRIRPSVPQLQADALVQLAEHALGCAQGDLPLDGATVVVRMDLDTLTEGIGLAGIDGVTQPISPKAARHLAATAGVIPAVLDGKGEIIDWGRMKRLFTRAQKLALAERDGGCAMCHLPPGMTKAHHLNWWHRDHGRTDIDEGVLLCESCHHRIHDNGWQIRIDGHGVTARVWFIPPPTIDPTGTPRLGGRARFEYHAA
ncbi:HNH endonuclease [Microbacterium luticocti]|uniref:HNH endonuclease n=1 Tax=Microbacterium luticocti TaxID=451764 RepID=UPI0003F5D54D|nr:HNH endonuclease signature motif containing protein [Microbacterium luticocti]